MDVGENEKSRHLPEGNHRSSLQSVTLLNEISGANVLVDKYTK
jgi:hypothetical protein